MQIAPPVHVRVPGSTSNLGPGFDLVGLALSLGTEVEVRGLAAGGAHELTAAEGEAALWPRDATNLVFRAFDAALAACGGDRAAYAFTARSELPLERGLGSSGAAIAAGLLLGAALGRRIDPSALLAIGVELEGHPDNVAASLFGGCTLCLPRADGAPLLARHDVHADVGVALAWSDVRVPTAAARRALPEHVAHRAAVDNARRLAILLEGLRTGRGDWIAAGLVDELHVPYRLPLIPGGEDALAAARAAGAWGATVSGSGSALLALGPHGRMDAAADAMAAALARHAHGATGRVVEIVRDPPHVRRF